MSSYDDDEAAPISMGCMCLTLIAMGLFAFGVYVGHAWW